MSATTRKGRLVTDEERAKIREAAELNTRQALVQLIPLLEEANQLLAGRRRPTPPSLIALEGDGKSTKRRAKLAAAR